MQPDPLLCVETGSLICWDGVVPPGSGEPMYRNPLLCMETGGGTSGGGTSDNYGVGGGKN